MLKTPLLNRCLLSLSLALPGILAYAIEPGDVIPVGTAVPREATETPLDLFVICGQSNSRSGRWMVPELDRRYNPNAWMIITFTKGEEAYRNVPVAAAAPMYSVGKDKNNMIGFGKSFADTLGEAEPAVYAERDILIFNWGFGGTGFTTNRRDKEPIEGIAADRPSPGNWDPDKGDLYPQMIQRIQQIQENVSNVRLAGILWHQGESDVKTLDHDAWLATMQAFIARLRSDLQSPDLPFVVGGLVPSWNRNKDYVIARQQDLRELPQFIPYTGYADPFKRSPYETDTEPVELGLNDEPEGQKNDATHFSAVSQRQLGKRYVEGYLQALTNTNP